VPDLGRRRQVAQLAAMRSASISSSAVLGVMRGQPHDNTPAQAVQSVIAEVLSADKSAKIGDLQRTGGELQRTGKRVAMS
jgi:hypothetical protein